METEHYAQPTKQNIIATQNPDGRGLSTTQGRSINRFRLHARLNVAFFMGYICSVDEVGESIPETIQIYVDDTNKLKSIGMVKMIDFNYHRFKALVNSEQ
jgi:hypothetical protein